MEKKYKIYKNKGKFYIYNVYGERIATYNNEKSAEHFVNKLNNNIIKLTKDKER